MTEIDMYTGFTRAAKMIEHRWVRERWTDDHGGVCLAQSVAIAFGARSANAIPSRVMDALDSELQRYWYYRRFRRTGLTRLTAVVRFNDAFLTRQSNVVSVLTALSRRYEADAAVRATLDKELEERLVHPINV